MALTLKGFVCIYGPEHNIVWLSQVFRIAYCQKFCLSSRDQCQHVCEEFVSLIKQHFPQLQKKVKIHLLLHLTGNMVEFGPTSSFNTERYVVSSIIHKSRSF